jgi:hypothetical protein
MMIKSFCPSTGKSSFIWLQIGFAGNINPCPKRRHEIVPNHCDLRHIMFAINSLYLDERVRYTLLKDGNFYEGRRRTCRMGKCN